MAKKRRRSRPRIAASVVAVLIIVLGVWGGFWLTKARSDRLNLLVISIDTMRADHVSCYGYERQTTPNIDLLASQGHRFSNAYTTISTTGPAHASLLTSLYPTQLSVRRNGDKLAAQATTLAEVLQALGYDTAAFVSAWVLDGRYGLDQGFCKYDHIGRRTERNAAETFGKATTWLKKERRNPFFLFVHFFDPHGPYMPPGQFAKLFRSEKKHALKAEWFERYQRAGKSPDYYDFLDRYDGEIAYVDMVVGRLMYELEQLDLDENTLVVLVSDHGESLGELATRYGYVFDHGEFLYAHQVGIITIIRMPLGLSWGQAVVHSEQVSIVDIMPTVLDLLGVEEPGSMAGVSLVPMMRGEEMSRGPVFSERRSFEKTTKPYHTGNAYSIIEGKWHMISSTASGSELYDLAQDPGEVTNLLRGQEKEAQVLRSKLRSWLGELNPLFGPTTFESDKEAIERLRSLGYVE